MPQSQKGTALEQGSPAFPCCAARKVRRTCICWKVFMFFIFLRQHLAVQHDRQQMHLPCLEGSFTIGVSTNQK